MILQCPKCKKQYTVDSSRITEQGVKITCPTCRHQFVARKKKEDGETSKPPAKAKTPPPKIKKDRPRTPPCAVCGEPSTHVFRGPPPRPLCEQHFQIEKEKDSRFFEGDGMIDPGSDEAWDFDSATDDAIKAPAKTKVAPPAGAGKKTTPAPTAPEMMPPQVAEPAFESFDDTFGSLDAEPPEPSESQTENKEAPGLGADFISSAHEFMMPGAGLVEANEPSPESDTPENEDQESEAPPEFDRFGTGTEDLSEAPPPAEPDQDEPASQSDLEEDVQFFEPPPSPPKTETGDKDPFSEFAEADGSFAFIHPSASRPEPKTASLELDLDKAPGAMNAPEPKPALKVPAAQTYLRTRTAPSSRGMGPALTALIVMLIAVSASGFLSLKGAPIRGPADQIKVDLPAPEWAESLIAEEKNAASSLSIPTSSHPDRQAGYAAQPATDESARRAFALMLLDTPASHDQALRSMAGILGRNPNDPAMIALKIEILAFSESLGKDGEVVFRAEDSASLLASMTPEQLEQTPMLRPRAHSLINQKRAGEAKVLLEKYLKTYPRDAVAMYLMGLAAWSGEVRDQGAAVSWLERAVKLDPDLIRARWHLAEILRRLGRSDEALKEYDEIAARSPDRPGLKNEIDKTKKLRTEAVKPEIPAPDQPQVMDLSPERPMEIVVKPEPEIAPEIPINLIEVIREVKPDMIKFDRETRARRQPATPNSHYERPPEEAPPE